MLSFKESHLNERLSLLTIIIIGEGVIGVTKVIGKMWPTDAVPEGGVVLELISVVILLVNSLAVHGQRVPNTFYSSYYGRRISIIIPTVIMERSSNNGGLLATSSYILAMLELSKARIKCPHITTSSSKSITWTLN
jgi:hypothetical protein